MLFEASPSSFLKLTSVVSSKDYCLAEADSLFVTQQLIVTPRPSQPYILSALAALSVPGERRVGMSVGVVRRYVGAGVGVVRRGQGALTMTTPPRLRPHCHHHKTKVRSS